MFNAALDANFHLPEEAKKTSETLHQTDISLSVYMFSIRKMPIRKMRLKFGRESRSIEET